MTLSNKQWDFLLQDILDNIQYNDEETQEKWTEIYLRLRSIREEDDKIRSLCAVELL